MAREESGEGPAVARGRGPVRNLARPCPAYVEAIEQGNPVKHHRDLGCGSVDHRPQTVSYVLQLKTVLHLGDHPVS